MARPTFLITGATGFLGRRVVPRALTEGRVLAATSRPEAAVTGGEKVILDVTDRNSTLGTVARVAPDVILHLAAINPGQGDDETMRRVNVDGSRHVAEAAAASGARLVAVSTDVLHDGTAGPYRDDATPTPLDFYGRSKAEGEAAVLDALPSALVVRTSLMYAVDEMDRGTAGFARRLAAGEPLRLFTDVWRNPVWVETLADALVRLAATDASGTLNVAGSEAMTRETYALALLDYWGIDDLGRYESVRAADVSTSIPLDVRLDSSRAEALLWMTFPGVTDVLTTHPRGTD